MERSFTTRNIASDFITQTIYFVGNPVTGTRFRYYEEDGSLSTYLVNETVLQINNLINPVFNYSSGTEGTVTLSGGKKVMEITVVSVSMGATIVINGGDPILLPASGDVSVTITLTPKNLTDPTIVFTGTSSYLITYN